MEKETGTSSQISEGITQKIERRQYILEQGKVSFVEEDSRLKVNKLYLGKKHVYAYLTGFNEHYIICYDQKKLTLRQVLLFSEFHSCPQTVQEKNNKLYVMSQGQLNIFNLKSFKCKKIKNQIPNILSSKFQVLDKKVAIYGTDLRKYYIFNLENWSHSYFFQKQLEDGQVFIFTSTIRKSKFQKNTLFFFDIKFLKICKYNKNYEILELTTIIERYVIMNFVELTKDSLLLLSGKNCSKVAFLILKGNNFLVQEKVLSDYYDGPILGSMRLSEQERLVFVYKDDIIQMLDIKRKKMIKLYALEGVSKVFLLSNTAPEKKFRFIIQHQLFERNQFREMKFFLN